MWNGMLLRQLVEQARQFFTKLRLHHSADNDDNECAEELFHKNIAIAISLNFTHHICASKSPQ